MPQSPPSSTSNISICTPQKNKNICFCNCNPAWGGGEKWHFEAASALAEKGWNVHLICLKGSPLHERALQKKLFHVTPVSVGKLSFLHLKQHSFAVNYFKQHAISSVLLNLPSDLKLFGIAAKRAGVSKIIYRRGSDIPVKNTMLNRYLYKHVITMLIANSKATAHAVLQNNPLLIKREAIYVLYNGIDAHSFDTAFENALPLKLPIKDSVNSANKPLIIGNAGRLAPQKAQHLLLFLSKLLQEKAIPHQIIIAGMGEREKELKELSLRLGVADNIFFTGFMEDLAPFWKCIDIFFLSSLWEGFGFVLVEAMLAKKPLIAFDVSNMPELVFQGSNGILLKLPEENNMNEALIAIKKLRHDPALCEKMGENGRHFALENFSQENAMNTLETLLQ